MLPLLPTFGTFFTGLLMFLFVLVCLFMMLVILIQKPRGGGLTGAFGGAGGSASSVFGAKTGDVLTWFTVVCFVLFIGLAMALTWAGKPGETSTSTIITPASTSNPFGTTPGDGGDKDSLIPESIRDGGAATKDGAIETPVPKTETEEKK